MTIHREGRTFLFAVFFLFSGLNALVHYLWSAVPGLSEGFAFLSAGGFFFFLQFFRNPKRHTPQDERAIFAPADGKVVAIEETEVSEYLGEKRRQVSIFMSPLNMHKNTSPIAGRVSYFRYHPGKYLVAWHPKSSSENERTTLVLQHASGAELLVRQIAGAVARRICWYVAEGQSVEQGGEIGFIKFGSRVDVMLPLKAKVEVEMGQAVRAGQTILAWWE